MNWKCWIFLRSSWQFDFGQFCEKWFHKLSFESSWIIFLFVWYIDYFWVFQDIALSCTCYLQSFLYYHITITKIISWLQKYHVTLIQIRYYWMFNVKLLIHIIWGIPIFHGFHGYSWTLTYYTGNLNKFSTVLYATSVKTMKWISNNMQVLLNQWQLVHSKINKSIEYMSTYVYFNLMKFIWFCSSIEIGWHIRYSSYVYSFWDNYYVHENTIEIIFPNIRLYSWHVLVLTVRLNWLLLSIINKTKFYQRYKLFSTRLEIENQFCFFIVA